jgi:hypothetical protein
MWGVKAHGVPHSDTAKVAVVTIMLSPASGFSARLEASDGSRKRRDTGPSLSPGQRATLTHIADSRGGVRHCELPAGDLVTLLRSYLVRFTTPDIVEATARGRQVLEACAPVRATAETDGVSPKP